MHIYTYCSNKGSRYGYQYASFTFKSGNKLVESRGSAEKSGTVEYLNEISEEFIRWCEKKNGWQLVLEKIGDNKYILMAGQLEKSRELKKKQNESKAYAYTGTSEEEKNNQDSGLYMSLGFQGTASEIKPIAIFMVKQYKDGFCQLFDQLEKTVSKSADATKYEIDTIKFEKIFSKANDISGECKSSELMSECHPILQKIFRRSFPNIYLSFDTSENKKDKFLSQKKKRIDDCANLLNVMEKFSERLLVVIAYDYFEIKEKINIHIEYEYLWHFRD